MESRLILELPSDLYVALASLAGSRGCTVAEYAADTLRDAVALQQPPNIVDGVPLVEMAHEEMERARARVMHGRHFDVDSVELLREIREDRTARHSQQ